MVKRKRDGVATVTIMHEELGPPSASTHPSMADKRARAVKSCTGWNAALLAARKSRGPQWDYATAMYHVAKESKEYYQGVTRIIEAPAPAEDASEKSDLADGVIEFGQDGPSYGNALKVGEAQLPPPGMARPGQPPRGPALPQHQIQLQQLQLGRAGPGGAQPPLNPFVQGGSPSFNNGAPLPQQSPVPVMPPTFGPASPFIPGGPGGPGHPMQASPGSPQGPFHPQFLPAQAMQQQQQLGGIGPGGGMGPGQVFGQQGPLPAGGGMFAGAAAPPMGFPGAPQPPGYGGSPAMMSAARVGMNQPGAFPPGTSGMSAVQIPPGIMGQGIGADSSLGGGGMPSSSGGGTAINLQNMQSMGGLQQQQQFLLQQQMQMAALMRAQAAQQQGGGGGSGPGGINPNAFNPAAMAGRPPSQQQPPGIAPQQMANPPPLGQGAPSGGQDRGTHSPSPGLQAPTPRARMDGRPQRQPRERKGMSEYVMIGDDVPDAE